MLSLPEREMISLEISFYTSITEKGVVAAFERLDHQCRPGVRVGVDGVVSLNFSGNDTAITDAAVTAISQALDDRLHSLTLYDSPSLTDAALDVLGGGVCSRLEKINVMHCG